MSDRRGRFVEAVSRRSYDYPPTERARMLGEIARRKRTSDRNRRFGVLALALVAIGASSWLVKGRGAATPVENTRLGLLADGSRLIAGDGASWVMHEVTPSTVRLEVPFGRVRFEVSPRPEREFIVTAQDVTVTVVGTVFTVDVTADGVRVEVESGRVRVRRGDGSEKVLVVGEVLMVASAAAAPPSAGEAPVALKPEARRSAVKAAAAPPVAPSAPQTPPSAPAPVETTFAALVAEGDAQQAAGNSIAAVGTWARAIEQFPTEPGRAGVAFRRARVMLQSLNDPAGAADAFSRLESLGAAPSLLEDALAREVEAWAAADERARARQRANDFIARFPGSYRRAEVERAAGLAP